jgi:hypothetical protein
MRHHATEPRHFRDAEQATRHGDRQTAYHLMRQALIDDPTYIPAWLSMSKLVDDIVRQRECLNRVLTLDPQNKVAREGIESLRLKELLSSIQAPVLMDRRPEPRQIGICLVEQQLISQEQLQEALREQRQRRGRGEFIQLGDLLLEWRWVAPNTLARALVAQLQEKTERYAGHTPRFLGEYLIAEGIITPMQLEAALEEQIRLRLAGQRVAIGQLLVRQRYLSVETLQRILDDQRSAFYSSMGD